MRTLVVCLLFVMLIPASAHASDGSSSRSIAACSALLGQCLNGCSGDAPGAMNCLGICTADYAECMLSAIQALGLAIMEATR